MPKRILIGTVVSDKTDKTVVVKVERKVKHPLYGKIIRRSKKYHAHDEDNAYKTGETVRIDDMRAAYWNKRFTGARRVDGVNAENAAQMLSRLPETLSPPIDASRPGP